MPVIISTDVIYFFKSTSAIGIFASYSYSFFFSIKNKNLAICALSLWYSHKKKHQIYIITIVSLNVTASVSRPLCHCLPLTPSLTSPHLTNEVRNKETNK